MKPALAFRQPAHPSSWKELPNGELVLDHIDQVLAPWWPKFFGYYLLKIGALSGGVDTKLSSIKHHITVAEPKHQADISADIDDLPLLEHSIDVCVLSHALEFSLDPHHVIREANRVLIPNGYLVISGFNPFSLVALNKLTPYRREQSPWNGRFFSAMRVKDWLHLMGYEILDDQKFLHSTLTGSVSQGIAARNWRRFASRYLPNLGSVYVIVAKKRVLPLTPIKPKWKLRTKLETINVSTMNSSSRHSTNKSNKS